MTDRDVSHGSGPLPGASGPFPADPRAAFVADLSRRMAELAAAGDVAGARVAHEAIARLLDLATPGDGASVASLAEARARAKRDRGGEGR